MAYAPDHLADLARIFAEMRPPLSVYIINNDGSHTSLMAYRDAMRDAGKCVISVSVSDAGQMTVEYYDEHRQSHTEYQRVWVKDTGM